MRRKPNDLVVVLLLTAAATAVCGLAGAAAPGTVAGVLRVAGGLALVAVLPGYALTVALFPARARDAVRDQAGLPERDPAGARDRDTADRDARDQGAAGRGTADRDGAASGHADRDPGDVDVTSARYLSSLERGTWSVALSLALAALGALVLNLTAGGLNRTSWLLLLAVAATASVAVAGLRRRAHRRAHPVAPVPQGAAAVPRDRVRLRAREAAALLLALGLIGGAIGLARGAAENRTGPGFTQLWLVSGAQDAHAGPEAVLGVRSAESGTQQYRIRLTSAGRTLATWSFTLAPQATWQRNVDVAADRTVQADLYRGNSTTPYREVTLVAPAQASPTSGGGAGTPGGQQGP